METKVIRLNEIQCIVLKQIIKKELKKEDTMIYETGKNIPFKELLKKILKKLE